MRIFLKRLYVAPLALAVLGSGFALGQTPLALQVTAADFAASTALPALQSYPGAGLGAPAFAHRTPGATPGSSVSAPGQQGQIFYPLDVSNPHNSATIDSARHHPIYVNGRSSTSPDVATLLADLGASQFIHLLDQYVRSSADNRYTLGTQYTASLAVPADNTFRASHFYALLHAAAAQGGSGYGHIYHIFLPQGVNACYQGGCYTPGNPATIAFCSLHDSVTFNDAVGHVVFTLEPYLDAPACSVLPGTPNGPLADTTYTFLSHEVFEAISDPDGDAWFVQDFTFAYGAEIGDNCQRRPHGNVTLNGRVYNLQPEYSNQFHGCAYSLAPDGAWSN